MRKILFPGILAIISIIVCISNFVPGTYLSGWDTIHPEFNFFDYFSRVLSVWQQHQGLGAVAAQAHGAELPRLLIYYVFYLVAPSETLRYIYFFLTLILGPLGVYFFTKEIIKNKLGDLSISIISFLSGLYYLLNLATLQQYTVPLEMFATHYATVGWLFLFSTKYILTKKNRDLIIFSLLIFFSAPMAHTPTLFYVFSGIFFIYLITLSILSKISLKRSLMLISFTLLLNFYWILPNIYYIYHYGESVISSKINSQFSDQAVQTGLNFGNPKDSALLRNFLFDWGQYDNSKKAFVYLLENWNNHLQNPRILLIGLSAFFISLLGIIFALRKKDVLVISLIPVFLISYFFITNDNPLFKIFVNLIQSHFTLLNEALRFPFTKFSILLQFTYSVFFAYALVCIIQLISTKKYIHPTLSHQIFHSHFREKVAAIIFLVIFTPLFVIYASPFFSGNLINPIMKVKIPEEYFETFNYFNNQDKSSRIALFPVNTFWAWSYYSWDYEGAGFLWFGLKQPLLNREFDRWMPYNENFYWEVQHAVYSKNTVQLKNVLNKYQVNWILLDENTIDPASEKTLMYSETEKMFRDMPSVSLTKTFGNIKIYKINNQTKANKFVGSLKNLPIVGPKYKWQDYDKAYFDSGNYISTNDLNPDIYYPFRSLFSNQVTNNIGSFIKETPNAIIFKSKIPFNTADYQIKNIDTSNNSIPWIDPINLSYKGALAPEITLSNQEIAVTIPKVKNYYSSQILPYSADLKTNRDCDYLRQSNPSLNLGKINNKIITEGNKTLLKIESSLANNCGNEYLLSNLPYDLGYLISVESKNIQNKSLLFRLENLSTHRTEIETFLPKSNELITSYFIQPPTEGNGSGYFLHFDNYSYNKIGTINYLGNIEVNPIPYFLLANIVLEKKGESYSIDDQQGNLPQVSHPSSPFYNTYVNLSKGDVLTLFQAFDSGWHAYEVNGLNIKPFPNHVLINSWANGWVLDQNMSGNVWIIFMPEFLEIFGFGIFAGTFFFIFSYSLGKRKKK